MPNHRALLDILDQGRTSTSNGGSTRARHAEQQRQRLLLDACVNNDLRAFLSQIRETRTSAAFVFEGGCTPLMVAARANAVRIVHWICLNDTDAANHGDERGNTALHYACARGNGKCVAALLSSNRVQVDAQNKEGATPLHYAAYRGHKAVVLQVAGDSAGRSSLDARDSTGKTALMLAAFRGHTQTVSVLVGAGSKEAGINVKDKLGWTALMYAAYTGRVAICRELLECGADPAPTEYAARQSAEELAQSAGYYEVADMLRGTVRHLRSPSVPYGVQMPAMLSPPQTRTDPTKQRHSVEYHHHHPVERALSPASSAAQSSRQALPAPLRPPPIPSSIISSRTPVQQHATLSPIASGSRHKHTHKQNKHKHNTNRPVRLSELPTIPEETAESNIPKADPVPQSRRLHRSKEPKKQQPMQTPEKAKTKDENIQRPAPRQRIARRQVANTAEQTNQTKPQRSAGERPHVEKIQRLERRKKEVKEEEEKTRPHPAVPPPPPICVVPKERSASPLHTPICVDAPSQCVNRSRGNTAAFPGSGWVQQQQQNQEVASTPQPLGLQERIKDTVSRASLKFLDSRTEKALRHEASLASLTAQAAQQLRGAGGRRLSGGGYGRREAATPVPTSPYKRYHDSAKIGRYWRVFAQLVTLWMPSIVLRKVLRKETAGKRQAWREKIALCLVIGGITAIAALVSFGLSFFLCHPVEAVSLQTLGAAHGADAAGTPAHRRLTAIRGRIYDVTNPKDVESLGLPQARIGGDASALFAPFPEEARRCSRWPTDMTARDCYDALGGNAKAHSQQQEAQCTASEAVWKTLRRVRTNKWVVYEWSDVLQRGGGADKLFVYNEAVYSLKPYGENSTKAHGALRSLAGTDGTLAVSRSAELQRMVGCWDAQLRVGRIEGTTVGCAVSAGVTLAVTAILNAMLLIKLACAVVFDWAFSLQLARLSRRFARSAGAGPARVPHVLVAVTCYNEDERTLRATLDAVALSNYARTRKTVIVVADGLAPAAGGATRTTPDILRAMIHVSPTRAAAPLPYLAVGDGPRAVNAAQVVSGAYTSSIGITIACILVVKVGTAWERARATTAPHPEPDPDPDPAVNPAQPGNRGKRDSQLIIMRWLHSVLMNDRLTPLEFELCCAASRLARISPDQFEYLLMVDADTAIDIECLPRLVAAMERDRGIVGLCGETRIANKRASWVTRIQVYEYYISHHLSKAFESLWGGVTCLPGCCSMYRVFARCPTQPGTRVPLLVAPEVIAAYSSNDTHTLHRKNLLLLGEDRYLTTVLLRAFPRRKLVYVPRAICRTTVPSAFAALVSQRRRWINSTIHNLLELVLVRDLCGTFCCSMQFLVLMDLVGNVVLPASVVFFYYLIVAQCVGLPVSLPLLLMALAFVMQGAMILLTTQRIAYVYWMLIYVAAIPVWNLALPLYAFWRFDDFSWGGSRSHAHGRAAAAAADAYAEFITNDERLALEPVPLMRWKDWARDNLRAGMSASTLITAPKERETEEKG
ncbi:hypothetical protein IWW48_001173 [Coemansia sp. RSA 1200]|nr:hypothetical protein IWW48_001173 [Coemansia sp. RSA 1200]